MQRSYMLIHSGKWSSNLSNNYFIFWICTVPANKTFTVLNSTLIDEDETVFHNDLNVKSFSWNLCNCYAFFPLIYFSGSQVIFIQFFFLFTSFRHIMWLKYAVCMKPNASDCCAFLITLCSYTIGKWKKKEEKKRNLRTNIYVDSYFICCVHSVHCCRYIAVPWHIIFSRSSNMDISFLLQFHISLFSSLRFLHCWRLIYFFFFSSVYLCALNFGLSFEWFSAQCISCLFLLP